jgi:hypothetical protein
LWRVTPRRLDAEQVRDAMLAVSGELSTDAGGPPVEWGSTRRSVYTKQLRNTRDRLLESFDAPESFCSVASRTATTSATQSLLMMNGDWPLRRAAAFAARVRREARPDVASQVETAYRLALGRTPTGDERDRAARFVAKVDAEAPAGAGLDAGLVDLCHGLLNSNEFLYVD